MDEFSKLKEQIDNTRNDLQRLDKMRSSVVSIQDSIKSAKSMYESYNDYMLQIRNKLIEMGIHCPESVEIELPTTESTVTLMYAIAEYTKTGNVDFNVSLISDTILNELLKHG